jgi:hypothetical protein
MGSVFLLMALIFYIGAVMATKLFGPQFPEWFGTWAVGLYAVPDHDAGKLVHGHRAPGDGGLSPMPGPSSCPSS